MTREPPILGSVLPLPMGSGAIIFVAAEAGLVWLGGAALTVDETDVLIKLLLAARHAARGQQNTGPATPVTAQSEGVLTSEQGSADRGAGPAAAEAGPEDRQADEFVTASGAEEGFAASDDPAPAPDGLLVSRGEIAA